MDLAALQADERDHLGGAGLAGLARDPLDLEREGGVLQDGEMGQEGEVLEHHAHLAPPGLDQLGLGHGEQVASVEFYLAGGGLDQP